MPVNSPKIAAENEFTEPTPLLATGAVTELDGGVTCTPSASIAVDGTIRRISLSHPFGTTHSPLPHNLLQQVCREVTHSYHFIA